MPPARPGAVGVAKVSLDTMKQVVQEMRSGETRVIEVPVPSAGPGMALVRTAASVVSAGTERMLVEFAAQGWIGRARSRPDLVRQILDKVRREGLLSTLAAVQNRLDQPMPLGYSSSGVIEAVGDGLHGFRVGDRVACAGGGHAVHAQYAVVPQNLMAHVPEDVDLEQAALATLGAIALHGLRLAEPQVGESVAVIGLGLLGLLAAMQARAAGARVFGVDLDAARVERARQMGFHCSERDAALEGAASATQGGGFDIVLVCADTPSSDPVDLAGQLAQDRGRVVVIGNVGLDVPRRMYYEKELSLRVSRSYGPGRYDPLYEEAGVDYPIGFVRWTEGRNLQAFVDLLAAKQLDVQSLITHHFPIESAAEAYEVISGRKETPFLGVVITYPDRDARPGERVDLDAGSVPSESSVRLGVLGAGNFATGVLLPAVKSIQGVERVGIASGAGLSAATARRKFGFRYAACGEQEILADASINTVAILTRHGAHARQTVAALRAGKHVFCEKPLALTREQLSEIAAALQGSHQLLTVGYNRRFAPLAIEMRSFLRASGAPLAVHYRVNAGLLPANHWLHDPEQGGGRLIGEACHFFDFLTFLVGVPPIRVTAAGLPDGAQYREDNVLVTLEYDDGSVGMVMYIACGDRSLPKERVEAFAGGRVAVLDDFRRLETFQAGRRHIRRTWLRQDKGHRAEWQAFEAAIRSGGPPPIAYDQLMAASLTALAAVDALRTRKPVALEPLGPAQ
jgi:predicted dehydrogenase/threonine dehydrogenase-like Zn-dependent dehydrogenase